MLRKAGLLAAVLLHLAFGLPLLGQPRLSGSLLDSTGQPLTGGRIELVPVLSSYDAGRLRLAGRDLPAPQTTVQSDTLGRFVVTAPQAGAWKVVVRAPGRVPMQFGPLLLLEPVELPPVQLSKDAGLRVRVLSDSGQPVADAWVLASESTARPVESWRPEIRIGRTAGDGSLVLPRLDGERLQASIFSPGRTELAETIEPAAPEVVVQLRPHRETTASLRVMTPDGLPVEGVLVRIGDQAWPIGTTAADGTVPIRVREGEAVKLRLVTADGRQQVAGLDDLTAGETRSLTLARAVLITGKVLDAATGRPLLEAALSLEGEPGIVLRTDRDGRYSLTVSEKGRAALEANAAGFLPRRLRVAAADTAKGRAPSVSLERAATVQGVVVGPDGAPVAGATVVAVNAATLGPRMFSPLDPAADRAVTGSAGGFELGRLRTGESYEIRAIRAGFFPAASMVLVSAPARTAPVRIQLQAACAVQGRVRSADGQPVTGARVVLRPGWRQGRELPAGDGPAAQDPAALAVDSGEAGRFTFAASPAAEVDLEVRKAGFAPARKRSVRLGPPASCNPALDLGTVVLQPGARLAGRVVDARGKAIAGANVFLLEALPPRAGWESTLKGREPDAVSSRDGGFAVEDLPRSVPRHLLVTADGYLTAPVRGVRLPGRVPLLVRMDPAGVLQGRVVDEAGDPVSGARVTLTWQALLPDAPREQRVGEAIERTAISNASGSFEVKESPLGSVTLGVTAQGFISIEDVEATVPVPDPARELTLVLRRGARLEGLVATTAGEPVAGARVSAGGGAAFSDADGIYAVEGVATGHQQVDVFHPSYRRKAQELVIDPGINRLDVELDEGLKVLGRVLDQDGRPVAAAQVGLTALSRSEPREYRARTGEDGSFLLAPVATGRYRLSASAAGFARSDRDESVVVADRPVEGLEVVLRQGATLHGSVLGLTPEELAAVRVTAQDEEGENRAAAMDSEGRFEIRNLPAGDWLLRASLWQGQRQVEARVPVGPSDRELERDLEFTRKVSLSGRVLFDEEPLAGSTVSIRGEHFSIERSVTSGFDGSFVLEDLEPDRYWLGVRDSQRFLVHNDTLDLTDDRDLTIRLEAATVSGRVEAAGSGDPIDAASLALRPTTGTDFLITESSQSDGTFRVIHIPPGTYRLTARASGYTPAERELTLAGGDDLTGVELSLTPTGGLEIQVRLADGQTPPLVHVLARSAQGAPALAGTYAPKPGGGVALSSLPAGTWDLFVSAPGGAMARETVTVPGKPRTVALPGAGRVVVRVRELATQNVLATVRLVGPGQQLFWTLGPGGTVEQSWTLRGGKGTIESVPAGQWLVVAETSDGRVWQAPAATPGTGEVTLTLE